jgi:long-subunit fatty acid transport protein
MKPRFYVNPSFTDVLPPVRRSGARAGLHAALPRFVSAVALSLLPTGAFAGGGLATPRVGGLGPNSPTEGGVASIYWNPATMTLLSEKLRLSIDISYTSARGTVQRFVGPEGAQPDETTIGGEVVPLTIDIPVPYLGAVYKINPKLAVGFAFMVPVGRSGDFIGACRDLDPISIRNCELNSPVRYQTTRSTIQSFYLTPSVAYQVTRNLSVGASFNAVISQFASDAAVDLNGREDPENQAFAHIGSVIETPPDANGVAVLDLKPLTSFSPAGSVGVYYTPNNWIALGASYSSRVQVRAKGPVVGEVIAAGQLIAPAQEAEATVEYTLPDTINIGAKFQLNPQFDVDVWAQYVTQKLHDKIEINLSGFEGSAEALNQEPEDGLPGVALARQFQNNMAVNLGVNYYTFDRKARVGAAVMYESSAIADAAQNSASIDGNKLDFLSYLQYQANEKMRLTLGFSYIRGLAPIDNRGESIFNGTFDGENDCNLGANSQANAETGLCYAVGDGIYQVSIGRVGLSADFSF